jgi:hypothetical protein
MLSQGALARYRSGYRVGSASKDDKEGVTLGIYLVTMPLREGEAKQPPHLSQHFGIALAQMLKQTGGPFQIGEQ